MVVKIVCPLCGENLSIEDINFTQVPHTFICPKAELQKRADRADQSVLFFLAGANLWEKHAKNCAILCIFVYFLCIFWC